jgi:inorganic pyrophosphatase
MHPHYEILHYGKRHVGQPGSIHYRIFFTTSEARVISPFHDIPLCHEVTDPDLGIQAIGEHTEFNMVVEIPKGEKAKMEIARNEAFNPIKQDTKNDKLRFVHWPYPCNYGAFPQTWENYHTKDHRTQYVGDKDPLDVCEIGDVVAGRGEVIRVKVLGIYGMIDDGETDWKVIAINVNDPKANLVNSFADINEHFPGKLTEIFAFLRYYKMPAGSGAPNKFYSSKGIEDPYNPSKGEDPPQLSLCDGPDAAIVVIRETYDQWRELYEKGDIEINIESKSVDPGAVVNSAFTNYFQ